MTITAFPGPGDWPCVEGREATDLWLFWCQWGPHIPLACLPSQLPLGELWASGVDLGLEVSSQLCLSLCTRASALMVRSFPGQSRPSLNFGPPLALAAPAAWLVLRLLSTAFLLAEIPSWLLAIVQSHPHRMPWKPGARPARSQDFGTGPLRIVQTSSAAQ